MAAGCNNDIVVISSKNHSETIFARAANIVFAFSAVGFVGAVKTFISSKSFQFYLISSTITEYVVTPGATINFVISFIPFDIVVSSFATNVIVAFHPKDDFVIMSAAYCVRSRRAEWNVSKCSCHCKRCSPYYCK